MTTPAEELQLDRLDERAFFIRDSALRKNVKNMCAFAFSIKCHTLNAVRPHLNRMGAEYAQFVQEVNDHQYDELFNTVAQKTLWSESEQSAHFFSELHSKEANVVTTVVTP